MTKKTLVSNTAWNTLGTIVYFACQWLITLVVVWLFDDFANAGNLALAMNVTNIFYCIAAYNIRAFQVSDVHNEYSDGEYIVARVITCITAAVLCVAFVIVSGYPENQVLILLCYMAFRSVEAFIDVLHGIVHKHLRLDLAGISMIARGLLMLAAFCVLGQRYDLLQAIIGMAVITALFGLLFDVPKAGKYAILRSLNRTKVWLLLKRCFPLMAVILIITFFASYTRYTLERIHGTALLGAYSTAVTPAVALQLAASFLLAPLMNLFSECVKIPNRTRFKKTFAISCMLIAGLTFVAYAAALIAGRWGLKLLFGDVILPYTHLLPSAVFVTGLTALLWLLNVVFSTLRDIKGIFFGCLAGAVICIASAELFIREYGLIGTNYAMIACQGTTVLLLCIRLLTLAYGGIKATISRIRIRLLSRKVKFSILTPLYNTDRRFLTEMIESVLAQTYGNWELCMADGSGDEHGYVEEICKEYAIRDKRIKYQKLTQNQGIAENTNACLALSCGNYISFFDHDDLLTHDALYETMRAICEHEAQFIYSDEDKVDAETKSFYAPVYKPDYAPDFLRSTNYICHFVTVSRDIVGNIGLLSSEYDGAQDFDFVLRATEQTDRIFHIPKVLYHWRVHSASTTMDFGTKSYAVEAGRRAIGAHLGRLGLRGSVENLDAPGTYRVKYELSDTPLVTIIIPNKDHIDDLDKCISSVLDKTSYEHYEILIVENNSENPGTFDYYKTIEADSRIRLIDYDGVFNYSRINNFAAGFASGEYLVFLNNDTQVLTDNWLEEMLMFAQRADVGIVGAKLYYDDFTVQHAGLALGLKTVASHICYRSCSKGEPGYMYRLQTVQNYSAVTAACMMMEKGLFHELGGFSEDYAVAYNDIDFCMKVRDKRLLIVWTPFCELIHHELTTRGLNDTPEKMALEDKERTLFTSRWKRYWRSGDPYYNVNFSRDDANYAI